MLGRDLWSRLMFATRISLTIGLVGVALSLSSACCSAASPGYYGGSSDTVIQRVIEILRSIPTIPLWMGLAAALPSDWSVIQVYFAITIIISLIGWTELARVVRGRFLSLQRGGFRDGRRAGRAAASRASSSATWCPPSSATSSRRPPWPAGHDHQRDLAVASSAWACGRRRSAGACCCRMRRTSRCWRSRPGCCRRPSPVIVVVLAFNFLGDGLRDAADPYL